MQRFIGVSALREIELSAREIELWCKGTIGVVISLIFGETRANNQKVRDI